MKWQRVKDCTLRMCKMIMNHRDEFNATHGESEEVKWVGEVCITIDKMGEKVTRMEH